MRYEIISTIKEIYTFSVLLHPTPPTSTPRIPKETKGMVTIFPLYLPAGARFLAFLPVLEYRNDISPPIPLFVSPCLLFPFLLPDTSLNVFARANSYCYPSCKLRLVRFDCLIYILSFTLYYKMLISEIYTIIIIYNRYMSTSIKSNPMNLNFDSN